MFLEFLSHLISLDFAWIADLIMNNLLWVFLLAVYVFIAYDGKKLLRNFLFIVGALWIVTDIFGVWKIGFAPFLFMIPFVIAIDFFIAGTAIEKHKTSLLWASFFVFSFLFTFFI
ncbi:MAG TPA: hypothetical protein VI977_06615 [archaeon]|nr:hypothetical protein [archaeon]